MVVFSVIIMVTYGDWMGIYGDLMGINRIFHGIYWELTNKYWLVVDLPLWKMMEFVSRDDFPFPTVSGKS
jgi:hypothetical protein